MITLLLRFSTASRRPLDGAALSVLGQGPAAQDVVQDVFVELWCHPDRYNPDAGSLRVFLTVLARHRAVDVARSELRRIARQERYLLARHPWSRTGHRRKR